MIAYHRIVESFDLLMQTRIRLVFWAVRAQKGTLGAQMDDQQYPVLFSSILSCVAVSV